MTLGPDRAPEAARRPEQAHAQAPAETPTPLAPVPLPATGTATGTLVVGPAADREEVDADRQAGRALARLRPDAPPVDAGVRRQTETALQVIRRDDDVVPMAPGETTAEGPAPAPTTMANLLRLSDFDVDQLVKRTGPEGGVIEVLKGPFEADWFKAKSALVFDKWPGAAPAFSHASSLKLMTALTVMRGKIHDRVTEATKAVMKKQLEDRADGLGAGALRSTLLAEAALPPAPVVAPKPTGPDPGSLPGAVNHPAPTPPAAAKTPSAHVDYKGSVGADTVTSDVDVSTGGLNSEIAVRAYNEEFRKIMGGGLFDPGTVFDLNVYAMDFIHGRTDSTDQRSFVVKTENPERPDAPEADARDREQDIWALVHVARYLPDDADWKAFVTDTLKGITDPTKVADQTDRLTVARRRAKGFEDRLLSMMEHLEEELDFGVEQLQASSWDAHTNLHHLQGALRMRAANKIYEDKLLQVKQLRAEIAAERGAVERGGVAGDPTRLKALVARLSGELSMAQLYANEVYGSGGGTVHAVMGMQTKKKLAAERGHDVEAIIPKQEWYQTFTDNLGDVLKDYEHYGRAHRNVHEEEAAPVHPVPVPAPHHEEPDYWYAAFKMGKYADRMVDAIPHLSDGGPDDLISVMDKIDLRTDPNVLALTELAAQHVREKNGPSKDDPVTLKSHPYFGPMKAEDLQRLRASALSLGALVRKMVATTKPPAEVPAAAPTGRPAPGRVVVPDETRAALQLDLAGKRAKAATAALLAAAAKAQAQASTLAASPEAGPKQPAS